MGFKLGGFLCDGCSIFHEYEGTRSANGWMLIPDGWNVISKNKVTDNCVQLMEGGLVICCVDCSRSLKINKIQHDVQSKIQKSKECQC